VSHFPLITSLYSLITLSSFSTQPEYIICIFPLPGSNGAREIRLKRGMQANSFELFKEKILGANYSFLRFSDDFLALLSV
jgi:hypothetical protein